LLIIDPSVVWPEDEGVAEVRGDWAGECRVLRPALSPANGPRPGDGYPTDGIVLLGSRASVHDDLPWLRDLGQWLDPVLRGAPSIPVLGICFGHQVIAARCGGTVDFVHPDRHQELGVRRTFLEHSRLMPGESSMRVVVSHRESVRVLPPGFRIAGHREGVPIDVMEHEALPIYGVQFHPEARAGFLTRRGADAGELDAEAIEACSRLLSRFRAIVSGT
jgi:GMP synthase-like glutamine amidotransferase